MCFFNTEGPVDCARHYCLPPLERLDLTEVRMLALADHLNREGRYRAVYANIEVAQAARENVSMGMTAVVEQIARGARDQLGDQQATAQARGIIESSSGTTMVEEFLTRWCEASSLPTVLLLDKLVALGGRYAASWRAQMREQAQEAQEMR